MKKLFLYILVLTGLLTSCSNDDITVSYPTTFKVDPSTVISSYLEFNTGDLTSLGTSYQLRIRLLIYDESGKLVASGEQFSPDYTHVLSFDFNLPKGQYRSVAITDVVGKTSSAVSEFYTLSGEEVLTQTTLTSTGKIGGVYNILGLTSETHILTDSRSDQIINVRPAGALIVCAIDNWNSPIYKASDGTQINVSSFALFANQVTDDLTLWSNGEPVYSVKSSTDLSYRWFLKTYVKTAAFGYGYSFKFPMKNVKMRWGCYDTNDKSYTIADEAVGDIEAGKEYYFYVDIATHEAEWSIFTDIDAGSKKVKGKKNPKLMAPQSDAECAISEEIVEIKPAEFLQIK